MSWRSNTPTVCVSTDQVHGTTTAATHCVNVILAPAAKAVEDRSASRFECLRHLVEAIERNEWCAEATHVVAVVVLEIINTPRSKAFRILSLVVERSSISCTSEFSSARVHAEQQILVVQSVRYSEHAVWELGLVDDEVAVVATAARPAVIEHDVVVAEITKAVVYKQL